eukprot:COSAG02_NODE_135_length_34565_cov_80.368856_11_plen_146_part_00
MTDAVVFAGAYLCVRMGLSTQHLHMLVETMHLSSFLSWFDIDLSPDSQAVQGAGHLVVTFVIYKLVSSILRRQARGTCCSQATPDIQPRSGMACFDTVFPAPICRSFSFNTTGGEILPKCTDAQLKTSQLLTTTCCCNLVDAVRQ